MIAPYLCSGPVAVNGREAASAVVEAVEDASGRPSLAGIGMAPGDRAPYATDPRATRGRFVPEGASPTRTPYQRDRDRIVHSTAFRRLKHKTQVFIATEGDHYRTRLTHTIEVSQIARAFARALRIDEDLTEAVALAHDFGHTPFGHAGERALNARMAPFGGFDHNAQTLRVVTALERRYAEFDGLNLSWETLEGLVKHNGPLTGPHARPGSAVPQGLLDYDARHGLDLDRFAGLEAQAAAIADDVAYDTHDLDDGLRAGLLDVEELSELALAGDILAEVRRAYPTLERSRLIHEVMRRHITRMVEDVITASLAQLRDLGIRSAADVRSAGQAVVRFSPAMQAAEAETKRFLFARVYRNPATVAVMDRAEGVLRDLFDRFLLKPAAMGEVWGEPVDAADGGGTAADPARAARRVADYLAGMTDNYALRAHRRLFDVTPDLG